MSKDMEVKQHMPSVIARLMGLDQLPPQQPIHKPQRVLSEDYLRKSASIGLREKRSSYGRQLSRIKTLNEPDLEDVFEVPKQHRHSVWSMPDEKESSLATKGSMTFTKQTYAEAKYGVMDQIQDSMECNDKLENICLDKDNLLKIHQKREILFPKQSRDQNGLQTHYLSGQRIFLKSFSDPNYRKHEYWKPEKMSARGNVLRSRQKHDNDSDTLEDRHSEMENFSEKLLTKERTCHSPTRIIVLKPNPGSATYTAKSTFSPRSHRGLQFGDKKKGIPRIIKWNLYYELRDSEKPAIDSEPSRHDFRISSGTAKEKGHTKLKAQIIRNSSSKVSISEAEADDASLYENEVNMPSCDRKIQNQISCTSNHSLSTKEAKNQLAKNWKITNNIPEVEIKNRCCSLGEMLSSSNVSRSENWNYKLHRLGLCGKLTSVDKSSYFSNFLGVSSKDGLKNETATKASRVRLFPAFPNATKNPKSRSQNEVFENDNYLMLEKAGNKLREQIFSGKSKSKPEGSKFSCQTSQSSGYTDLENSQSTNVSLLCKFENGLQDKNLSVEIGDSNCPVEKPCLIQDELDNSFEECITPKAYKNDCTPSTTVSGNTNADVLEEDMPTTIEFADVVCRQQTELPSLMTKDCISSRNVSDTSVDQESPIGSPDDGLSCSKIDLDFSVSLMEAYQPSPNSVLEPPYGEEISSDIESFGSVGIADLHGLWKQLQLLKSEADYIHSEGPGMMVSSDEGTRDESFDFSKENENLKGIFRTEESRDFSYLVDVLDEAGFHGETWEIDFGRWHSSECTVNPSVFEVLEKKYGELSSWTKPERRLLFDQINSGLMEILQPFMDIHKWKVPLRKKIGTSVRRDVVEEELWSLLVSQEKEVSKGLSEKAVGGDTRWLELGDDIDIIVSEIENFLFNELAAELGST